MPKTQTGRIVIAELNGLCPWTRESFVAAVIAIIAPLTFIASVGTNRLGSVTLTSSSSSTEIFDTILPASVTVTPEAECDHGVEERLSSHKRRNGLGPLSAFGAGRFGDRYTPRILPTTARLPVSRHSVDWTVRRT